VHGKHRSHSGSLAFPLAGFTNLALAGPQVSEPEAFPTTTLQRQQYNQSRQPLRRQQDNLATDFKATSRRFQPATNEGEKRRSSLAVSREGLHETVWTRFFAKAPRCYFVRYGRSRLSRSADSSNSLFSVLEQPREF